MQKLVDIADITFFRKPYAEDGNHIVLSIGVSPGPTLWVRPEQLPFSADLFGPLDHSNGPVSFEAGSTYVKASALVAACENRFAAADLEQMFRHVLDKLDCKFPALRLKKGGPPRRDLTNPEPLPFV